MSHCCAERDLLIIRDYQKKNPLKIGAWWGGGGGGGGGRDQGIFYQHCHAYVQVLPAKRIWRYRFHNRNTTPLRVSLGGSQGAPSPCTKQ